MPFRFSDDRSEMDDSLIHTWLSEHTYWAHGRTRELQDRVMQGSRNFGVFDSDSGVQVAYARVITDAATFAWIADVFVAASARGEGVGKLLIAGIMEHLEPLDLKRIALYTADAHSLYERFGFTPLDKPEGWMTRMSGPADLT
jgi:GNAT superfamily N-acetyltransferase